MGKQPPCKICPQSAEECPEWDEEKGKCTYKPRNRTSPAKDRGAMIE